MKEKMKKENKKEKEQKTLQATLIKTLKSIQKSYPAINSYLTGSIITTKFNSESDIDIIVEVPPSIYNQPLALAMKDIEDTILKYIKNADVFFAKEGDRTELLCLGGFTRHRGIITDNLECYKGIVSRLWAKAIAMTRREK